MSEQQTVPARRSGSGWTGVVGQMVSVFLLVMAAKGALAEPFYVPSGSMEPTLLIGDALLASKYPYGYSAASLPLNVAVPSTTRILGALPKRGDVVVFRWPGDRSEIWVKRVVGLPGDRIQMRQGQLYINGQPARLTPDGTGEAENDDGSKVKAPRFVETLPGGPSHPILKLRPSTPLDDTPEITVPAQRLFVLGDNRDNSADSRVPVAQGGVGLLPVDNLVGRVDAVLGSWDMGLRHRPVSTWLEGVRGSRFFTSVH